MKLNIVDDLPSTPLFIHFDEKQMEKSWRRLFWKELVSKSVSKVTSYAKNAVFTFEILCEPTLLGPCWVKVTRGANFWSSSDYWGDRSREAYACYFAFHPADFFFQIYCSKFWLQTVRNLDFGPLLNCSNWTKSDICLKSHDHNFEEKFGKIKSETIYICVMWPISSIFWTE